MGALATVIIRPGVEFTPDAAAAFRRAEAQVQKEFKRNINVNSTYRSWDQQLKMYNAWNAYVAGRGPYPGHSKAVHPSESFHVSGLALDSDDWTNARVVAILAENGFIRNRLHVPNENHHFEYIRAQDKNYGKPAGNASSKEIKVKALFTDDGKALRSGGLDLKPGATSWLNTDPKSATNKATNIAHLVGVYQFVMHVYAQGTPGDAVYVTLKWATPGKNDSLHFIERVEIGSDGTARANFPFTRAVNNNQAVHAKIEANAKNQGTVKVTRFAADALQFQAA